MADGTCCPTKRGPLRRQAQARQWAKIMRLVDDRGTPQGVDIASASPAEVELIERPLPERIPRKRPKRLTYDRAADSDALRQRFGKRCIELICPHPRRRKRPATTDGPPQRDQRRWEIKHSIRWLLTHHRLAVRYERHDSLFEEFSHWRVHSPS